jgi:maleate cis-trans isomerase
MARREDTKRIGLLAPSSSTTQEYEYGRILPAGITLHTTRLVLRTVDPNATISIVEEIEQESRKLADADVDVIVLAATAPSSRRGIGTDRELIGRMEAASGKRATTASTALIQALGVLGARKIAIAAPWSDEVNAIAASFIEASGVQVVAQRARGIVANLEIGLLDPETAFELGCAVNHKEADAVMLACGNWRTLGIVDRLEATLGKPVVTTNQVTLWAALRLLGQTTPVPGWGRLLRTCL